MFQAKILVNNPKFFDNYEDAEEFFDANEIDLNSDQQKTKLLKSLGYDGVQVKDAKYFVVFDRK